MTLVQDNHDGIIDHLTFDRTQAEMARRKAGRSPSRKASTGMTSYASKYALSERLVCGECGTLYRRCIWNIRGRKRIVWRCVSRLDYGTKYCHSSPTMDEDKLQKAILKALSTALSQKETLIYEIAGELEREMAPIPGETISLADIERRLNEINNETRSILDKATKANSYSDYVDQLKSLVDETAALKEKRAFLQEQQKSNTAAILRIQENLSIMERTDLGFTEWDESMIRQLVDTVKVLSATRLEVILRCGVRLEQEITD